MSEPSLSITADDDLPRTLRREREAREREARGIAAPMPGSQHDMFASAASGSGSIVTDVDMPFLKLAGFLVKAVLAGIPALLLLTALLWLFGHALQSYFPQLLKMKIDIQIYTPQSAADFRASPARTTR
jgi:hypothetical protein